MTREGLLDELDFLASVSHALCVEYLSIHSALGHDLRSAETPSGPRVSEAASAAFLAALGEMGLLHRVNRALTLAGRPAQVGRADSLPGSAIALGAPTVAELERLVAREREIATAVDARWARVCAVIESQPPALDPDLLGQLAEQLSPCPTHSDVVGTLHDKLGGVPATEFLRAAPREPSDDLERGLLALSDGWYVLILSILGAWFANEEQLGGELRGRALAAMDQLNAVNALLVARGLLPIFTRPE